MKQMGLKIGLVGLLIVVALSTIGCVPGSQAQSIEVASLSGLAGAAATEPCSAPVSETMKQQCAAWEQEILASTVRLEIRVFSLDEGGYAVSQVDGSSGHAAVKDGRYLVTHNHYAVSLTAESPGTISRLTLLKANGDVILTDTPLSAFRVVFQDSQTQVLDFGDAGGTGLFAAQGIPSATFRQGPAISLLPGAEVAQINWDGQTTHIDWVRVTAVHMDGETPYLEVDNYVERGASGGGVYLNGDHIGNNWSRSQDRSADTGEVLRTYSIAALNAMEPLAIVVQ